jgi:hypothetical protein
MPYPPAELKRKLRDVKRIEIGLRFKGNAEAAEGKLVWDEFFDIKRGKGKARYPIQFLVSLDRQELKNVLDEYFYFVYFRIYRENGLSLYDLRDPNLLELLSLSPMATELEIKKRFRELAKKYHPDTGGDSEDFIKLMDTYGKLTSGY